MNSREMPGPVSTEAALRPEPWPHFVFDNFLGREEFVRLASAAESPSRHFEIEPGDEHRVEFSLLEDIELAKIFISIEFVRLIRQLTGVWCELGEGFVQVRRANPETPEFPVHVDSGGPRSYVALLYVSPNWSPGHGGGLSLHATEAGPPHTTLDPIPNRLVVFEAASNHWHSVEKTLKGARYSILSEWIAPN